jgi:ABC-type Fe3+ transport system substrate-binding protein
VVPPEGKATIEGVVTDEAGDPVSGASVTVDGETVTTGSDGAYSFEVDAGTYTVTVSKSGYDETSSSITATGDGEYTVDLNIIETDAGTEPDPDTGKVELKIITRHGSDILFKARAAFLETDIAAEYGITDRTQIKFLGVSSSLWVDTITRSGDIDIAWGGGPVVFDIINTEGLLSPLESDAVTAILDIIPDEISGAASKRIIDDEVMWVGSAISSFGFTINKEFLETEGLPEPTTWMDLGNETYAQFNLFPSVTAIGTADATLSTSNTRMFEIILQTYGWKDGWELLTRPEGQEIWLDKTINRMPINPAVFDTTLGQTRPDLETSYTRTLEAITIDFSDELALSYETAMMFFYKGTLVEAQLDLIDTWIELVDAEEAGDITHKEFLALAESLGNPLELEFTDPETGSTVTFTESYAQGINDRITTDADFKSTLKDSWRAAAIARYHSVLDDLYELTG